MNKKQKSLTNKGFSLVELIIVIAIMAVLIGVLAPQYLKYVERSRESADLTNYQEILSALQIYAADPSVTATPGSDEKVTVTSGTVAASGTWTQAALTSAGVNVGNLKMKSSAYASATITVTKSTDGFEFKVTGNDNLAAALAVATTSATPTPTPGT
ncbi:type II secretion system protein [Waltera intestinalis]|uniref:Prepilin-type N-terminal cleavage/methylation domain-containing protein n=1 Tax=Waltera intestinalis TaxID=2606635 RepID=A0A6L5YG36_9FIRM|nr:prepilin-type N-terminal cleavage/methylation domain-containing protein [Waltera intestinalis]MST57189.1 prepilin-type N-terminal cleavage/methylation domain-containing protein [Waltera intestinalis]